MSQEIVQGMEMEESHGVDPRHRGVPRVGVPREIGASPVRCGGSHGDVARAGGDPQG